VVAGAVVVVVAVAALTVGVVLTSDDGAAPGARPVGGRPSRGDPAPDLALRTLTGDEFRLSDLRGRPVVVNFWASWCHPCREEFPLLAAARAAHRHQGLVIVGVDYRDIRSDARAFARQQGARWTLLSDPDGVAADVYGIRSVPQTFFVRPDGTIASRLYGVLDQGTLDRELDKILR
jgi:cytochrome c biogenesis protein CcmG/thiol:disulfide interchange protein DsbE